MMLEVQRDTEISLLLKSDEIGHRTPPVIYGHTVAKGETWAVNTNMDVKIKGVT